MRVSYLLLMDDQTRERMHPAYHFFSSGVRKAKALKTIRVIHKKANVRGSWFPMEFVPDWSYGGRKLSDFSEYLTRFQGVYVGEKLVALLMR